MEASNLPESGATAPNTSQKMLPEWQRQQALARAALVRLYLQEAGLRPRGERAAAQQQFIADYNFGLSYPELFGKLGKVSYQTLQRWAGIMAKTADPLALAPHWGEHRKGKSEITPAAAQVMISVALHPHNLPLNQVVRQGLRLMAQRGIADGHSEGTYLRFLRDYRKRHYRQWIFQREGQKSLNDKCLPYLVRDYDLIQVGDAAVADGHKLNFEILNPWTGKPQRMILLLFFDLKSRMPLGWEIMPTENTQSIAVALRRAILRLGMAPRCIYIDNGKAFRAEFFSGTPDLSQAGLGGLFHRLEMEVIYAWPYHGQSKPIERFFGEFAEMERLMPTYIGTSIAAKPAYLNRGERLAGRVHRKMTGGFVPTIPQAHAAIAQWFDEYAGRTKKRGYLKGTSPGAVFEAGKGPGVDPEQLRELLMPAEVKTIRRNGIYLPHTGEEYYHRELSDRRHPVVIRYDWQQPDFILVYEKSGEFICKAEPRPRVHPLARITGSAADRELLAQEIALKKSVEKETIADARRFAETVIIPESREYLASQGMAGDTASHGITSHGVTQPSKVLRLPAPGAFEDEVKAAERRQAAETARAAAGFWQRLRELPEQERYEALLELEVQGRELPGDDLAFMRYFEQTETYQMLGEYFEDRRLLFSLGQ